MIPLSATCINNWYFKLAPACPQPLHTDAVRPKRTTYGDISLILRSCFVFPKLSSISSRNLCSPTIDQAHVLYTSGFQHPSSTRRRVHSSLVVYNDKRIISIPRVRSCFSNSFLVGSVCGISEELSDISASTSKPCAAGILSSEIPKRGQACVQDHDI
ncbi:hypothetical protein FRC0414_01228 [Corynebacterium diphtheriae]|nr:hypothetical protein FRC0285_01064 [Corynebacterium diphtheriae]CAB0904556.1 hypothetical protein FRC0414_01228 [Corynebacterium diphtheriae]